MTETERLHTVLQSFKIVQILLLNTRLIHYYLFMICQSPFQQQTLTQETINKETQNVYTALTFVMVEKFFCEYRNVKNSLVPRSIRTVGIGTSVSMLMELLLLTRLLHVLNNMQLRVVCLNLLNILMRLDLCVGSMRCRLL